jgi:hypothetical protein
LIRRHHLSLLTGDLHRRSRRLVAVTQLVGRNENLGCHPTPTPWGQQPRSTTLPTIPFTGAIISLFALGSHYPVTNDNAGVVNCQAFTPSIQAKRAAVRPASWDRTSRSTTRSPFTSRAQWRPRPVSPPYEENSLDVCGSPFYNSASVTIVQNPSVVLPSPRLVCREARCGSRSAGLHGLVSCGAHTAGLSLVALATLGPRTGLGRARPSGAVLVTGTSREQGNPLARLVLWGKLSPCQSAGFRPVKNGEVAAGHQPIIPGID